MIKAVFISRKKASITAAILLLLVLCCVTVITEDKPEQYVLSYGIANKIIAVDPGHGGLDQGATRGELIEKDITLEIGKKLTETVSKAGAMVILLRENESDLAGDEFTGTIGAHKKEDMKNRVNKANKAGAELYISIHTNAVPNTSWSGSQVFYQAGSEESKIVAEAIQEELSRVLGNTKRKPKPGDYYVLRNTKMPAVIVEVGFISNPGEGRLLMDAEYQAKIAYAISAGIARSQIQDHNEKE